MLNYYYDSAGKLVELGYIPSGSTTETYYFITRNSQGDITGIYQSTANATVQKVGSYTYDSWGKLLGVTTASDPNNILNKNPFRYRGYYFDRETNWYYLQSRYYDPQVKRFLNADTTDILGEPEEGDTAGIDKNLFAYCDNDPVNRTDDGGYFWEELIMLGLITAVFGGLVLLTVATGGIGTAALVGAATTFGQAAVITGTIGVATGVAGAVADASITALNNNSDISFAGGKKGKENMRDSGLRDVSTEDLIAQKNNRSLTPQQRQKIKTELKARGEENIQKRKGRHRSR